MIRRILLLAVAVVCACSGVAAAKPWTPLYRWLPHPPKIIWMSNEMVNLAEHAARAYWGAPPCAVSYRWSKTIPPSAGTAGVHVASIWAWTVGCTITFNRRVVNRTFEMTDFPSLCALMVHEWGHLFGHWDSAADSPTSITYPVISERNERVWSCVRRYRAADRLTAAWVAS